MNYSDFNDDNDKGGSWFLIALFAVGVALLVVALVAPDALRAAS